MAHNIELLIRSGTFLSIFAVMATWELLAPRSGVSQPRRQRWATNLGITALNTVLVWVIVGGAVYQAAVLAERAGFGLLHVISLPGFVEPAITLFVLDCAIYLQHVMFHALPILWRLHRVHHADLGFDVTTGLRFHPLEIFLSIGFKVGVVLLLGGTPWSVVAFEALLNASSLFEHSNVRLGWKLDRAVRYFIVTPNMHRIHHSPCSEETNSNFGFSLSIWDRMCGTYRVQGGLAPAGAEIGLAEYRDPRQLGLAPLLLLPFRGTTGGYAFSARSRESNSSHNR